MHPCGPRNSESPGPAARSKDRCHPGAAQHIRTVEIAQRLRPLGFPGGLSILKELLARLASSHCGPAGLGVAAELSDHVWSLGEIVMMADGCMPKPGKRGPYRKKDSSIVRRRRNRTAFKGQGSGWCTHPNLRGRESAASLPCPGPSIRHQLSRIVVKYSRG